MSVLSCQFLEFRSFRAYFTADYPLESTPLGWTCQIPNRTWPARVRFPWIRIGQACHSINRWEMTKTCSFLPIIDIRMICNAFNISGYHKKRSLKSHTWISGFVSLKIGLVLDWQIQDLRSLADDSASLGPTVLHSHLLSQAIILQTLETESLFSSVYKREEFSSLEKRGRLTGRTSVGLSNG